MTADLLRALKAALARRDRAGANATIEGLVAGGDRLGEQWRSIASLALHHGEIDLAVRAIGLFVRDTGGTPPARHEQAVLLARAGRLDAAEVVLASLTGLDPATLAFTRATVALDRGRFEQAREWLWQVVDARPLAGAAWLALATADGLDGQGGDRLIDLVAGPFAAPPIERVAAFHAAGAVLHRRGMHDRAFAAFQTAAQERRALLRYDRAADAANAASATTQGVAPAPGGSDGRAIFVTGLPRSGTTLVEQILTAHSEVSGGGELNLMRLVTQDAGDGRAKDQLAHLYGHLLDQRFGPTGRVVDKTLTASRMMGLIATVLPDSPVLWVRRDPLDCAWSCFRTHFVSGAGWSLDLSDIAHHMRLEDALHARWSALLGERMLTIEYAELVRNPRGEIARILRHCGLTDEPGPYAPERNDRAVTTSSVAQVRRPIGGFGLGTAAPYRRHLAPFLSAYRGG